MTSQLSKSRPAWQSYVADFANMLKAFIGSNYLTVSYAFLQSGLGLGFGGLILIALVTDHCCHLIVKTKYHAIRHVIQMYRAATQAQPQGASSSTRDSDAEMFSSDEDEDIVIYDVDEVSMMEQHMLKHMSYGDIGQISMGKFGRIIVNFCIAVTQFCFCVNYSIFLGNTVYSLFPSNVCNNGIANVDNVSVVAKVEPFCELRYLGLVQSSEIKPSKRSVESLANFSYTGDLSDSNESLPTLMPLTLLNGSVTGALLENISTTTEIPFANTTSISMSNITGEIIQSTAPDLKLLVLAPLPLFLVFALFRNVRKMGFVSVLANMSILLGSVSVFLYLVVDLQIHDTIVWMKWEGLPIFFGMVTAAFEGIGLIIPVESSMEGNRHNFAAFLHGAIGVLFVILGSFGVMGYLRFGEELNQMLNTNIPASSWVSVAVNICAILGVLLTFPLQIYPVIEMSEIFLFSEGAICGPRKKSSSLLDEESEGKESLLPDSSDKSFTALPISVAAHIPKSVPTWKRNTLRMFIVLTSTGLAILFRNSFALVAAFTGAIGSSLLAYILPCLFHLKLCRKDLPWLVCFKDSVIILLGVLCSIVSLYSVILQLVKNTTV
uniref:Amino acid transporter AVT3A-like isoform X2 n=1 Tax=Crassostrea virginica TaxID=6565 RepID=A0A8B8CLX8_CRAVI|nr:amino acid transporter AVT3A-like isoform X2 [Crassostrea virginica]